MPNDAIKVTFGELENAASSISGNASQIEQQLGDLKRYLQPLVSSWQGDAMEQYQQLQGKWDKSAADLQQVLASIGTAVQNAAQHYQEGENANKARFA